MRSTKLTTMFIYLLISSSLALNASAANRTAEPLGILDARNTVMAVRLGNLDKSVKKVSKLGSQMSAMGLRGPAAALSMIGNVKLMKKRLGFDPSKAKGWAKIGLEPDWGVALLIDKRMSTPSEPVVPVIVLRLSNLSKFKSFLEKRTGIRGALRANGISELKSPKSNVPKFVGVNGKFLAICPKTRGPAAGLKRAFASIVKGAGSPLRGKASFKSTFSDGAADALAMHMDVAAVAKLAKKAPGRARAGGMALMMASKIISDVTGAVYDDSARLELGTTAKGQKALAMLSKVSGASPSCSQLFARSGWVVGRMSLNLKKIAQGASQLQPPPQRKRTEQMLSRTLDGIGRRFGLSWRELTQAFNGHACAGVHVPLMLKSITSRGQSTPGWLLALGSRNPNKALELITHVATAGGSRPGAVSKIKLAGSKGLRIAMGRLTMVVLAQNHRIVIAPDQTQLTAALKRTRKASLSGTPLGGMLDGNTMIGVGMNASTIGKALQFGQATAAASGSPAGVLHMLKKAAAGARKLKGSVDISLSADRTGLMLKTHYSEAMSKWVTGVISSIALPSFRKFQSKTRSSEANVSLMMLKMAARVYYVSPRLDSEGNKMPCAFPPSTPLTPARSCCSRKLDRNGDRRCDVNPKHWQHPTWRALNFRPRRPHYYRYSFKSSGSGAKAKFTITAEADQNCNGAVSVLKVTGRGDPSGKCRRVTTSKVIDVSRSKR